MWSDNYPPDQTIVIDDEFEDYSFNELFYKYMYLMQL